MGGKTLRVVRQLVRRNELAQLSAERLAELLAEQISALPYHEQKQWAARHLPRGHPGQPATELRPTEVLRQIEAFCRSSRQGTYQSWVDEHEWDGGFDGGDEGSEFQEWVELFTDSMKDALALTASGKHRQAVTAYRLLLDLLKDARENTDILGNHGAPEDVVPIDFSEVIGAYTRSLIASHSSRHLDGVFDEILPLARRFWYVQDFVGLAGVLDEGGRAQLKRRLSRVIEGSVRADRRECPREVGGLIALAEVERNQPEVLALKERFASRNARYLDDVLGHYKRAQDWTSVARLAEVGIRSFGRHGEYAKALVKAREALGDPLAAQEAQVAHFLDEPGAAAFTALRRKSQALSNWGAVFDRLVQASTSRRHADLPIRLQTLLLLAEGQESEALAGVARRPSSTDFDEIKFVAKYAIARMSDGADLAGFKRLVELERRVRRDREEPYDWLRLALQKPGTLGRNEYGCLAADMYRRLIEFHLESGKSSRATPAAHYAAIVAEVSSLLKQPSLWTDLLAYLRQHHGKKRLIWDRLKAEGCRLA